jgi:hypothetical protein
MTGATYCGNCNQLVDEYGRCGCKITNPCHECGMAAGWHLQRCKSEGKIRRVTDPEPDLVEDQTPATDHDIESALLSTLSGGVIRSRTLANWEVSCALVVEERIAHRHGMDAVAVESVDWALYATGQIRVGWEVV